MHTKLYTMRLNLILSFLFILFSSGLYAQQSGEIIYRKVYSNWDGDRVEVLKFDGSECVYIEENKKFKATTAEGYSVTYAPRDQKWYLNMNSMEVIEQVMDAKKKSYVLWGYQDTPYEWHIHDEFKTINGYRTQKATAMDKVSEWGKATVWFTTEIPLPYGPHRLFGLPGLILEASLAKDFNSKYVFDSIVYKDVANLKPSEGIWIDKKHTKECKAATRNNLRKALGSND